ncbi:uncharacterized protein PFL1_04815 [Pseudozyma flocculosa PF-1]|uniref:Uncharacterized protein n=2 Tax=Pseudozyma flocculosa TaxID=84751 RepID=A0A5C3F4Z9_9BASI|nr:uncharacterized protein PFL1_04815 [Pseudozyma flocculosa PF-1]EPQ27677.1 hypothetical protein PFL1_04815 [Pseudozyma flocculosa PF-1]SPO39190.1 uncharacterized protein PSFLO_04669 [Pseudozyma flocculosa]
MPPAWLRIDCGEHGKVLADPTKEYREIQKIAGARLECPPKEVRLYIQEANEDLWEVDESIWSAAAGSGQVVFAKSSAPTPSKPARHSAQGSEADEDEVSMQLLEPEDDGPQPDSAPSEPTSEPPQTIQLSKKQRKRLRREMEEAERSAQSAEAGPSSHHLRSVQTRAPTPAPAGFGKSVAPQLRQATSANASEQERHAWSMLKSMAVDSKSGSRKHWDAKTHRLLFQKLDDILKRTPVDRTKKYISERSRIFGILMSEWGDKGTKGQLFVGRSKDALTTRVSGVVRISRSTGTHIPEAFDFLFPPTTRQLLEMEELQKQKQQEEQAAQEKAARKQAKKQAKRQREQQEQEEQQRQQAQQQRQQQRQQQQEPQRPQQQAPQRPQQQAPTQHMEQGRPQQVQRPRQQQQQRQQSQRSSSPARPPVIRAAAGSGAAPATAPASRKRKAASPEPSSDSSSSSSSSAASDVSVETPPLPAPPRVAPARLSPLDLTASSPVPSTSRDEAATRREPVQAARPVAPELLSRRSDFASHDRGGHGQQQQQQRENRRRPMTEPPVDSPNRSRLPPRPPGLPPRPLPIFGSSANFVPLGPSQPQPLPRAPSAFPSWRLDDRPSTLPRRPLDQGSPSQHPRQGGTPSRNLRSRPSPGPYDRPSPSGHQRRRTPRGRREQPNDHGDHRGSGDSRCAYDSRDSQQPFRGSRDRRPSSASSRTYSPHLSSSSQPNHNPPSASRPTPRSGSRPSSPPRGHRSAPDSRGQQNGGQPRHMVWTRKEEQPDPGPATAPAPSVAEAESRPLRASSPPPLVKTEDERAHARWA